MPGQARDLYDGTPVLGPRAQPDAAPGREERHGEPAEGEEREREDEAQRGVVAQVEGHVPGQVLEGDAPAVGQVDGVTDAQDDRRRGPVLLGRRRHVVGVEAVDVLRDTLVEAEVTRVDVEDELRVPGWG